MSEYGLFKEPKNILDLLTFDLTTFFYEDDYEEVSSVDESDVFMIEYEKVLPWTELELFNSVIFRVFNDKKNILGSNHINVRFSTSITQENNKNIVKLIRKLYAIYGPDDENKNIPDYIPDNTKEINNTKLTWTMGEGNSIYSIVLTLNNETLLLEILFFNHLMSLLESY